ncbi:MAG: hypothetical protein ACPHQC_02225 [Poseidonia sp.]
MGDTMHQRMTLAIFLVVSMVLAAVPMSHQSSLDESLQPFFSGTADRVVIDTPPPSMSADEVVDFDAVIYDPVNNIVSGDITWSSSNGSITSDGLFFPWSSGLIEITAEHNGLQATHNISVTPGVATAIEITSLHFMAQVSGNLTADILDGRGNRMAGGPNLVWDIDGEYIGHGSPAWTPETTGAFSAKVRYNQLQDETHLTVGAGSPHAFVFPDLLQVRAGSLTQIRPTLVDVNGYEMPLATVPSIAWYAENGSFNAQGEYLATNTGRWVVSATSGNVTGTGTIQVIPGDAVASELVFLDQPLEYMAGESYELVYERRDESGYIGFVSPPIQSLSVDSGGLSVDDELRVYWNPSTTGPATISGQDGTVMTQKTVTVVHGRAIDVFFDITPSVPSAGDQVVLVLRAVDVKGNTWAVNGTATMEIGNADELTQFPSYLIIQAAEARSWRFEGNWFDNSTGAQFITDIAFDVGVGRLAFITLQGEGSLVPADGELDLDPQFLDAHGNQLPDIALNWTLDGNDITLDMLLNDGRWVATTLGGHELRVNADGVFATVRLTVIAGAPHALVTDADDGLYVRAGIPTDVFVQVVDVHGNLAEANQVTTSINTSFGELIASPTGLGYWSFTGKQVGVYTLDLQEGDAQHSIEVTVGSGDPIRIQATLSRENLAEGDVVLMEAIGTDAYGNSISIPKENTSVTCTAGDSSFVTNGTWEIDVSEGGTDRSCTIRWNGLLAQTFFDVDEVLLGGAVGSTNTAMTMAAILLFLILAVLIVLNRKASQVAQEDWMDEAFDDEDDSDEEGEDLEGSGPNVLDTTPVHERHGLTEESMKELAVQAGEIGVMQATPSTTQGETGWYVDVSEELQYWEVTPDGEWIRHE